jgi:hypothetical protein
MRNLQEIIAGLVIGQIPYFPEIFVQNIPAEYGAIFPVEFIQQARPNSRTYGTQRHLVLTVAGRPQSHSQHQDTGIQGTAGTIDHLPVPPVKPPTA